MTERDAIEALEDAELVPVVQGPLHEMKPIWRQCLEQEIPATLTAPAGVPPGSRLVLLVREADAAQVVELLRREWKDLLAREGVDLGGPTFGIEVAEGQEPPCPACGTAAPLVEGACSECGLQLE